MKFLKSIRFRMTLWYSVLIFFFALGFLFSLNIIVTNHYKEIPPSTVFIDRSAPIFVQKQWIDLATEEQQRILQVRQSDLEEIRKISALSLIPFALLSFIGGYFLATQMLKPINDINKATKEINARNLKIKIPETGTDDELGELIKNFNQMIERLNISFELQKQFVESASHELKTPLAVIKTNLDTCFRGNDIDIEASKENIQKALKSVDYMNKLVEDLLLLSFQSQSLIFNKINLKKVVDEIVSSLHDLAEEKHTTITVEKPNSAANIFGSEFYLSKALKNIIENSIKYSKISDGQTKINIEVKGKAILLIVEDNGIGIAKEDLPFVFNRFYRVDKSRSRKLGGTGLGLSIAKKIIEEHQGTIQLESEVNVGTKFTISLPKAI